MRFFLFILFCVNFSAQTVYKTPAGSKYHLASCRMVKNTSSALTVEKAQREGLSGCNICRPPFRAAQMLLEKPKKTSGVKSMVRCLGVTKKGLRCKRSTVIGNSYCFQHVPK